MSFSVVADVLDLFADNNSAPRERSAKGEYHCDAASVYAHLRSETLRNQHQGQVQTAQVRAILGWLVTHFF